MPRKEGPFPHGEKPSRPAEHRADGNEVFVESGLRILEKHFGADVVVDDAARANELRQEALRQRLAATANYEITPEELRTAREQEHLDTQVPTYIPEQTVPFSPLANMVDVTENQSPAQSPTQAMYELSGGPQ